MYSTDGPRLARIAIGIIGILLLAMRVVVDLDRNYVNYYKWMLDYSVIEYLVAAAIFSLIVFGRFPVVLAALLLVPAAFLQYQLIADSWEHIGRIAHGDDYGVFFVELAELYFLIALVLFTIIFHSTRAVMHAYRLKNSSHVK